MKKVFFLLVLYLLISCERKDVLFSAYDEIHSLRLYKNNEFDLLYNGVNSAEGKYEMANNVIYLTYNSDEFISGKHANALLTRMISIDRDSQKVESLDGRSFCARIGIDKLNK